MGCNQPCIRWMLRYLRLNPGQMTIEFHAGFNAAASSILHDLSQAFQDVDALEFNSKSPMDAKSLTTSRVGARYRGYKHDRL